LPLAAVIKSDDNIYFNWNVSAYVFSANGAVANQGITFTDNIARVGVNTGDGIIYTTDSGTYTASTTQVRKVQSGTTDIDIMAGTGATLFHRQRTFTTTKIFHRTTNYEHFSVHDA
jgi:hypothetical protein